MKILFSIFALLYILNASQVTSTALTLPHALDMLRQNNLEVKAANFTIQSAKKDIQTIQGLDWGKLTFTQDMARSNDAGNVFGFKLSSREATFGDFGFSEFSTTNPDILSLQPNDLNYPKDRNYFQSKLKYEVPLFTGFALSNYASIFKSVTKLRTLQKDNLLNEKYYQLKKSYYDMALLESSIKHLEKILHNIEMLEGITSSMIQEGYAKHIDLLEVKAKRGNVERLLLQMHSNEKLLYHYISFLLNKHITNIETPQSKITCKDYSLKDVLQNNLDIQQASTGVHIKNAMLQTSQALYYPTIGAFAELSTADNTFLGDAQKHKAYTLGARLSWNLFNGGIDAAKIEKSHIEQLKMKTQLELAKQGIALQVAKIQTEIQSADEEINSLQKELELADAIYKNYEGRYKEKLSSMGEVIIKQSAQIEKILQLQIIKNRRIQMIFALEKLANKGN